MQSFNVKLIALVAVLSLLGVTSALQCFQCGQYNDGVGSITPCLNYTAPTSQAFLKACPRSSQKFCIKYVSELSVVRDCVDSCQEKEAWGSKTLCCDQDGCNSAPTHFRVTSLSLLLVGLAVSLPSLLSFVH